MRSTRNRATISLPDTAKQTERENNLPKTGMTGDASPEDNEPTFFVHWERPLTEDEWRRWIALPTASATRIAVTLGLRYKVNDFNHMVFKQRFVVALDAELHRIATCLYAELSTSELAKCAATPGILDVEVGVLFTEYASKIWGAAIRDRGHIMVSSDELVYDKALDPENSEDEKMIRLHFHQWAFAKAFLLMKDLGDTEEDKAYALEELRRGHMSKFKSYKVVMRSYAEALREQGKKRKVAKKAAREQPSKVSENDKPPAKKSKTPDVGPVEESRTPTQSANDRGYTGLTADFLDYLQHFDNADFDETTDLKAIEKQYLKRPKKLIMALGDESYAAAFPHVLAAWLDFRHTIIAVQTEANKEEEEELNKSEVKIKNSRLLTELRKARDEFLASRADDMDAEDILVEGLGRMQRTVSEGSEVILEARVGLRKLDEQLREMADSFGNARWVFMN